jgi:hypothetical protein
MQKGTPRTSARARQTSVAWSGRNPTTSLASRIARRAPSAAPRRLLLLLLHASLDVCRSQSWHAAGISSLTGVAACLALDQK